MKVSELKKMARERGIKSGRMKKTELIRQIQVAEGNFDCFRKANGYCDQFECLWRDNCLGK